MSAKVEKSSWVPIVDPAEIEPDEETVEFWLCLAEDFEDEGNLTGAEHALERAVQVEAEQS